MAQTKKTQIELIEPEKKNEMKEPENSEAASKKPSVSSPGAKADFAMLQNMPGAKIIKRLSKAMIYLAVFLLPLFFLPWTSNILDLNKQALLLILVFLSLIGWLASSLISNKFEINTNFLNLPVIILFLVSVLSVIFSVFRYGSFWGWPLSVSASLLSLLGFAIFYFLIVNLFKKDEIIFLFLTLFVSGFLASLFGILQFFGKFILPSDLLKTASFNTVGTMNGLAIYSALLLLMMLPLSFFVKRSFKVILGIFILTLMACLFIINFKTAWLVLLAGTAVLFAFGVVNLRKVGRSSFVTLMMVFLVVALLFTFFRFSLPGVPAAPLEVSPTQKAELGVLKQLPIKSLFLGTGQGTFVYDWSRYKSADLNQTIFWATRFGSGASEVLDRIITAGILGILGLFFLIFVFFRKALRFLVKKMTEGPAKSKIFDDSSWFLSLGMMASFLGLVLAFFFYPANFPILLLFWLLIGSLAALETEKTPEASSAKSWWGINGESKTFLISTSPTKALAFSFLFVLILVLGIGFSVIYLQKYVAEARYFQGLKAFQRGNSEPAVDYISNALNLNPQMDIYWRDISQIYLVRLNETLNRTDLAPENKNSQIQTFLTSTVNSAGQATTLNPKDVANWNVRGFIYRSLIGSLSGAEDWAIKSYEAALDLEPANPYILTELGRVYLAKADLAEQQRQSADRVEALKSAQNYFEKAISLKPDYATALYQTAALHIREGKTDEAIASLELTKQAAPNDVGLAFQLGMLYYDEKQFDKAQAEFERAVALDSGYSNARYYLGIIYDRADNKDAAILQFEAIEKFNPGNEEVKKILSNLRAGHSALEGIVPSQPPIEEQTPENLKK